MLFACDVPVSDARRPTHCHYCGLKKRPKTKTTIMGDITGGQAFPTGGDNFGKDGMTLRDYFAAKAMQASFAGEGAKQMAERDKRYDETNWAEIVADNAYRMADAMLAERKKV